jgi:stress response protein SCP2
VDVKMLTKGGNAPLTLDDEPLGAVRVTAIWAAQDGVDVDACALLLGADGRARGDGDLVFYNQTEAEDGAVRLLGKSNEESRSTDRLLVGLQDLPSSVEKVLIVLSLEAEAGVGFGSLTEVSAVAATADEQPLIHYSAAPLGDETALVLAEVYRREGTWRFRAVGQGYATGLAGLAHDYGISVSADDAPGEEAFVDGSEVAAAEHAVTEHAVAEEVSPTEQLGAESAPSPPAGEDVQALPVPHAVAAPATRRTVPLRTKKRQATVVPIRPLTLADDETWKAARLFPIVGIGAQDEQERRATSALLAVLMGVREFGRTITGRLGAPAGLVETYLEVQFPRGEGVVIPDGVLRVERGSRRWTALLEVKTGTSQLEKQQVENYLDVARERGFDAVVTLSNELPAAAGEHPVGVDKRKLRKVALHHLAWAEVVHEATMQLSHRGVADPTQRWVLHELVRYLQHPRSGASGFEDMGSSWVPVRDAVTAGTLRPSDRKAADVAESWERLVRQVCLRKSGELGVDVTPVGARRAAADPGSRINQHLRTLVGDGTLTGGLRIPGAVGPMHVTANLRTGQIEISVEVAAPQEGRPLTRVNWLLRQLAEAPPATKVDALASRPADNRCELLDVARNDPKLLLPDSNVRAYRLSLVQTLGTKRGVGRGGFITSVHGAIDSFYRDVMHGIRPWMPPPPRPPAHDAVAAEDQPEATDEGPALLGQ